MSAAHIGIDPGIMGAIVGLDANGNISFVEHMPTRKNLKGKKEVDTCALADLMQDINDDEILSIHVEAPFWKPSDEKRTEGKYKLSPVSVMAARMNSGVVYGMAKMVHRDTELVQPATWKRAVGIVAGSAKSAAVVMAKSLWPDHEDYVKNDGIADALLIAYYGMKMYPYRNGR